MSNFSIDMTPFAASQAAQGQQLAAILAAVKAIPKPAPADNGPVLTALAGLEARFASAVPVDLMPITRRLDALAAQPGAGPAMLAALDEIKGAVKGIADALAKLAAPAEPPATVGVLLTLRDGTMRYGDVQRDSATRLRAAWLAGDTGRAELGSADAATGFALADLADVALFDMGPGPAPPADAPTRPG